jgi:uncharacterized membrane protein
MMLWFLIGFVCGVAAVAVVSLLIAVGMIKRQGTK